MYNKCPICKGELESPKKRKDSLRLKVLDGNIIHHCTKNKEHKFYSNPRVSNTLYQTENPTNTSFKYDRKWKLLDKRVYKEIKSVKETKISIKFKKETIYDIGLYCLWLEKDNKSNWLYNLHGEEIGFKKKIEAEKYLNGNKKEILNNIENLL